MIWDSSLIPSELHHSALKHLGPGSTVYRVLKASGLPHIITTVLPVSDWMKTSLSCQVAELWTRWCWTQNGHSTSCWTTAVSPGMSGMRSHADELRVVALCLYGSNIWWNDYGIWHRLVIINLPVDNIQSWAAYCKYCSQYVFCYLYSMCYTVQWCPRCSRSSVWQTIY